VTAVCGGGTSSPKPGSPQTVAVAGALITEGLTLISPWLIPFAALIDGFLVQTVSQCGTDPPSMPTFDPSDVANLVGGVLNPNLNNTLTKINNALLNFAWQKYCKCDSGSAPTITLPVAPPPGGLGTGNSPSQQCYSGSWTGDPTTGPLVGNLSQFIDVTNQLAPVDGSTTSVTDPGGTYTVYGLPSSVSAYAVSWYDPPRPGCASLPSGTAILVKFYDGTGTIMSTSQPISNYGGTRTSVTPPTAPPAGARYWRWSASFDNSGVCNGLGGGLLTANSQVFCGGLGGLGNCCPPDPAVMLGIQNILNAVNNLRSLIPGASNSFLDSTAHTGLTGSGSVVLSRHCAAIRVNVTAYPPGAAFNPGTPSYYFGLGYITPIALGNPFRGARLVYLDEVYPIASQVDSVGYTLEQGVTITITELIPGP